MTPSPHDPLISALTTFYTLLVNLRYIPASTLVLPSPDTGRHPDHSINRRAAIRHGFSDAAVDLAYRLPYVTDDAYRIAFDTQPLCYFMPDAREIPDGEYEPDPSAQEEGEFEWEFACDPTYQERRGIWGPNDVLVLTRGHVYGAELVYDVGNQTITEWYHFSDPDDWREVPAHPMTAPQNPLYVWIRALLTLRNLPLSGDIVLPMPTEPVGFPGDDASAEEIRQWRQRTEDDERERRELTTMYVDYGWPINPGEGLEGVQPIWESLELARLRAAENFRGEGFARCRDEWMERK